MPLNNRFVTSLFATILLLFYAGTIHSSNQDKRLVLKTSQALTGRTDRPVRPVKNIIFLIPDGCSLATISAARWYQWLQHPDRPSLSIDPYVSGTVRTMSSNAPIGDSAPTTSCYMTGELSQTGYVATYPVSDGEKDIFTVDPTRAYQPLMTILEAAKLVKGMSTGLVFTCEFPHATPADCSAHDYNRGNSSNIASQIVHNRIDFVAGGGTSFLKPDQRQYLKDQGYTLQFDDAANFRSFKGTKLWSLFGSKDMDYDMDRDSLKQPSLAEMTNKAIESLSINKKGFFLMVEGSKVDWAAHANDPAGMITEYLAFDRACKVAFDFAKKDGNTVVIVVSDHGNSGLSIGTSRMGGYDRISKDQLFSGVLKFKKTANGIAEIIKNLPLTNVSDTIFKYASIRPTAEQLALLNEASDYSKSSIPSGMRAKAPNLFYTVAKIMNLNTGFGFTTNGHTGEEVLLSCYNPNGEALSGVRFNFELNDYMCSLLSIQGQLPVLSSTYFAKHQEVFNTCTTDIQTASNTNFKQLIVTKGNKKLVLTQNSSVALLNGKTIQLPSVVVYVDKNQTFYVPSLLKAELN